MAKYYWQAYEGDDLDNPTFAITPADYFDSENALSDEGFDTSDLPEGFFEVSDSMFEFDGSEEDALDALRSSDLFEEKNMLTEMV